MAKTRVAKFLIVLVLTTIGIAFLGLAVVWRYGADLLSAQDEDMKLQRASVPTPDNAFIPLQRAVQKLQWAENNDALAGQVLAGKGDFPAASRLLAENQQALAAVEEALTLPRLQLPEDRPSGKTPYDLAGLRRLGYLLGLRAYSSGKAGNVNAALEDSFKLLRLGHLIQGGQGNLISYVIGGAMKSTALGGIRSLLPAKGLDAKSLEPIPARLEASRPDTASFREALQFEYTYMAAVLDDPGQIYKNVGPDARPDRAHLEGFRNDSMLARYLFHKNETKKLFADSYRVVANAAEKSCSQRVPDPDWETEQQQIRMTFWKPNVVGRSVFRIGRLSPMNSLTPKCRVQTEVSATQVLVALRRYRATGAGIPDSLQRLVPDYLPSIPVDDFDGQPMRYSPAEKLVYSVGEDLADDHGDRAKDVVFAIEF